MDRLLNQFKGSLVKGVVFLYGKASITNTTGVVASYSGRGIASIARTGAGEYTITLEDKCVDLLNCDVSVVSATPVDLVPQIASYDVVSAKTIVVNLLAAAVPTDSAQDIELLISIALKISSAN